MILLSDCVFSKGGHMSICIERKTVIMAEIGKATLSLLSPICKLDENNLIHYLENEESQEVNSVRKDILREAISAIQCRI